MLARPPEDMSRLAFQESLNRAIVHGLGPSRDVVLGTATIAAIDEIAQEHPEATADHIARAYDAFDREHGR